MPQPLKMAAPSGDAAGARPWPMPYADPENLPAEEHPPDLAPAGSDAEGPPPTKCVVLLVDDQDFVAEAIRRMLADDADCELHHCSDPARVMRVARELRPTVVLQDLVMPNADGLMLVRFLRANLDTRAIPIIVLSSKEHPLDKSKAFSAGASDYLVKLPDKIELLARIRAHSRSFVAQQQRDEAYRSLKIMKQKLEEANATLRRLTNTDGLTGIPNRRRFDEGLDTEFRRAYRNNRCLAAALIDIDFFKLFNDSCGHQQGDECLRAVAQALLSGTHRPGDLVARYGGEEFVALLPDTPLQGACVVAEAMRVAVAHLSLPHPRSGVGPIVSVSIGVAASNPREGDSAANLIARADAALYAAKRAGRNRVMADGEATPP